MESFAPGSPEHREIDTGPRGLASSLGLPLADLRRAAPAAAAATATRTLRADPPVPDGSVVFQSGI